MIIKKRYAVATLVIMLLISSSFAFAGEVDVVRIAGKNRTETAIEVSKSYGSSEKVILAGYNGEADALTGTLLAKQQKAPVLLVPQNSLPESVIKEVDRLGANKIYILGGTSVISESVEKELESKYEVERLFGSNRAETAVKILEETFEDTDEIFLALGYESLADALAIGPVSAIENIPILLTQKNKIPKETIEKINELDLKKITIIGGLGAINSEVEKSLPQGIEIERIAGNNREDTALRIANRSFNDSKGVIVANGYKYADALVGGHLAARDNKPILLASEQNISDSAVKHIKDNDARVKVLGGESAISNVVIDKIKGVKQVPGSISPNKKVNNITQLREVVLSLMNNRADMVEVDYSGKGIDTREDVVKFVNTLIASGHYHSANLGPYTAYHPENEGGITRIKIGLTYRTTDKEEAFIDKEAARIVKKITNSKMNDFDKVKAIHDYIVDNKIYTLNANSSPYAAYSFFKENKGVCNSFVLAFNKMLNEAGIENYYVKGQTKEDGKGWTGLHAWNKVKVGKDWYNIDITWNYPKKEWGLHNAYRYFMVSDERFYKTHNPENLQVLPKSNSKKYDGQYDNNWNKK